MKFVIFEPDPLVQTDIFQSLSAEFPNHTIEMIDSIEEVLAAVMHGCSSAISIISAEWQKLSDLPQWPDVVTKHPVVLIHNTPIQEEADLGRCVPLQRPFSSTGLISRVRAALTGLPSGPS